MRHFAIDLGAGATTALHLRSGRADGRLTLEISGGQSALLLEERGSLTTPETALTASERDGLASAIAAHPDAGVMLLAPDGFGGFELVGDHPFRFYSSLLEATFADRQSNVAIGAVASGEIVTDRGLRRYHLLRER